MSRIRRKAGKIIQERKDILERRWVNVRNLDASIITSMAKDFEVATLDLLKNSTLKCSILVFEYFVMKINLRIRDKKVPLITKIIEDIMEILWKKHIPSRQTKVFPSFFLCILKYGSKTLIRRCKIDKYMLFSIFKENNLENGKLIQKVYDARGENIKPSWCVSKLFGYEKNVTGIISSVLKDGLVPKCGAPLCICESNSLFKNRYLKVYVTDQLLDCFMYKATLLNNFKPKIYSKNKHSFEIISLENFCKLVCKRHAWNIIMSLLGSGLPPYIVDTIVKYSVTNILEYGHHYDHPWSIKMCITAQKSFDNIVTERENSNKKQL